MVAEEDADDDEDEADVDEKEDRSGDGATRDGRERQLLSIASREMALDLRRIF